MKIFLYDVSVPMSKMSNRNNIIITTNVTFFVFFDKKKLKYNRLYFSFRRIMISNF